MASVQAHPRRCGWQSSSKSCVHVLLVCVVGTISLTVGCINRTDAKQLSDSGLAVANSLGKYYDMLGQQVDRIVEMEAAITALRGLPTKGLESDEIELEKTEEALQRRAQMARQLASAYQSLKDLSSYDASGEVSSSFDQLGQALTGVPALEGVSKAAAAGTGGDPAQFLSKGAGLLTAWKQSRDIEHAVKGMTVTLDGVDRLFAKELPACQSISAEHVEDANILAKILILKSQVAAWPLLEQDLESIGLELANSKQPPSDPDLEKGLAAVVQARAFLLQTVADSAGQSLLDGLNKQLTSQRQFEAKQGINISDIQAAIEKANAFLQELDKQKQSSKQ